MFPGPDLCAFKYIERVTVECALSNNRNVMLTKMYETRARADTQVLSRQETNVISAILGKVGKHFEMINDNPTVDKPDND